MSIPHRMLNHPNFVSLTPLELKLLIDVWSQYNGRNNGSLTASMSLMQKRGWSSTGSLYKALSSLKKKGFFVVTKQGKKIKGDATLLAATWEGIDESRKDYDPEIKPSHVPLRSWETAQIDTDSSHHVRTKK